MLKIIEAIVLNGDRSEGEPSFKKNKKIIK